MTVPKLRFKEFINDWKITSLGSEIGISSASRVLKEQWRASGVPFFRTSDVISIFKSEENQKVFISYDLFEKLSNKSGRIKKGDLLITGGGSIGIPYLKKDNSPLYFKDADLLWLKSSEKINGEFLYNFFQSQSFKVYLKSISHTGTISHFTIEQAKTTPINLPSKEEQTKIANFLTTVDKKISQLNEQHQLMIQYKKGVMQKIFSQEIRFKDDNGEDFGEWEEKLLGDIVTFSRGKGISKSDITKNGKNPCIRYGELYTKYGVVIDEINSFTDLKLKDCVLSKANQVIIPASGETKIDIATASCVLVDNVILGGDINILTSNENGIFLANYLNFSKRMEISQLAQGISVIHLYAKQLANLSIKLPCVKEQDKIAKFLRVLDNKIESLALQLELTKTWKKGLLQKMFV
jgi:type I restriction enzyme, S subunit